MTTDNGRSAAPPLEALRVVGRDSTDFLHRLLTCAIKTLPVPGPDGFVPWMPGCILGGDGRIRHEVLVVRESDQAYLLIPLGPGRLLESGNPERLFEALDAYLFTEQVELTAHGVGIRYQGARDGAVAPVPRRGLAGGWTGFLEGRTPLFCRMDWVETGDGVAVKPCREDGTPGLVEAMEDFPVAGGGLLDGGLGLAAYAEMLPPTPAETAQAGANRLAGVDLGSFPVGVPMLGRDYTHQALPLEAGLKGCISFTKGCFPGQEIMARIENLGHPAKLIVGIMAEAGGTLEAGRPLYGQRPDGTWAEVGSVCGGAGVVLPPAGKACALVKWDWRAAETVLALGESAGPKVQVLGPVDKYPVPA